MSVGVRPADVRGAGEVGAAGTVDGRAAQTDGTQAGGAQVVETLKVSVGRQVADAGRRLRIAFVAVREDSRCPVDVQCIQAGNARIRLRLNHARERTRVIELNTDAEPREVTYANYTIKLMNLAPRPVADRPTRPRAYVATLALSKKS